MANKIKAIIFDWGGVLINDPAPAIISYCSNYLGVSIDKYNEIHKNYFIEFQKGLIAESIFWNNICYDLNVKVPDTASLWTDAFVYAYSPKNEMFNLASSLQNAGYITALLSNTELPAMNFFINQNYSMFDVLTFSCKENYAKPDKEIYEIALNKIDVKPTQAIFIDDKPDYIDGAKQVNINTILFNSYAETVKSLASYNVVIRK